MAAGGGGHLPDEDTAFSVMGDKEGRSPDIEVIEQTTIDWPQRRPPYVSSLSSQRMPLPVAAGKVSIFPLSFVLLTLRQAAPQNAHFK